MDKFTSKAEIIINAPAFKVWEALTNPKMVKQYLFGTDMLADWKVGGKITYSGEWEGKKYQDKGEVLELEQGKHLKTTYWSSMGGMEDKPENYQIVTYDLAENDGNTTLTLTQENSISQESVDHSGENWKMVLGKMKELVEKN